jgi:hypothetical protein
MDLKVEVSNASLDDVVTTVINEYDQVVGGETLGDAVREALLDRLAADPRWDHLAERFWDAVDEYMRKSAPDAAKVMVAAEVTRQLESAQQGAVTRGQPSTRAEAIVATEVTTQLRAQFAPVVEESLTALRGHLNTLTDAAVQDFLNRRRG